MKMLRKRLTKEQMAALFSAPVPRPILLAAKKINRAPRKK